MESLQALILHRFAYKDTSVIVKFFTKEQGLVSCVAKGAKRNKSPLRALVHPFKLLSLSFSGKNELKSLRSLESAGPEFRLTQNALLSGFYLNELLVNFLLPSDAHPDLFDDYCAALHLLAKGHLLSALRQFEWQLLLRLGYAPDITVAEGMAIDPMAFYQLIPGHALALSGAAFKGQTHIYQGDTLQNLHALNFTEPGVLRETKRLLSAWINFYLEGKPLKSRELFYRVERK